MTRLVVTAVLPLACVWAARHESLILPCGVALTPAQADQARRLGVVHPEKVRLLQVALIPPTDRLIGRVGTKLGFVSLQTLGLTLRYGIFIQVRHWGDHPLLVHELAHVAQYERLGGFRGFLGPYLRECNNPEYPFGELEAKRAEESCC